MKPFTISALAAAAVCGAAWLTPVAAQTHNDYQGYNNNRNYGYQNRGDSNTQYPSDTQRYGQGSASPEQGGYGQQQRGYGQGNYGQSYRSYGQEENDRNNRRYNYGRNDDSDRNGRNQQNYGSRNGNQRYEGQYGLGRSYNPGFNHRDNSEDND